MVFVEGTLPPQSLVVHSIVILKARKGSSGPDFLVGGFFRPYGEAIQ